MARHSTAHPINLKNYSLQIMKRCFSYACTVWQNNVLPGSPDMVSVDTRVKKYVSSCRADTALGGALVVWGAYLQQSRCHTLYASCGSRSCGIQK